MDPEDDSNKDEEEGREERTTDEATFALLRRRTKNRHSFSYPTSPPERGLNRTRSVRYGRQLTLTYNGQFNRLDDRRAGALTLAKVEEGVRELGFFLHFPMSTSNPLHSTSYVVEAHCQPWRVV